MRHILSVPVVMIVAAMASPAMWSETLAETIRSDALRLRPQIEAARLDALRRAMIRPAPLVDQLTRGLELFGFNTTRLAAEIDAQGGATDLRCIFRGMAEETDLQLGSIAKASTGAQQAAALSRLSATLRDAAEIAPAAEGRYAGAAGTGVRAALGNCPAEIRP